MKRITMFSIAVAGLTLGVPAVFGQEETGRQEVTVQAVGSFVTTTTQSGVQQSGENAVGVLGSYRYFFNRYSGVEANYSFLNSTQNYGIGGSLASVNTSAHEVSGAYILRLPMKRITPFVLAGAGGLVFDPRNFAGASTQARAAFEYGAGADLNLSKRVFVRAEYRGFVYDSPTYGIPGLNGLDRVTHRAEPSLGFGYRF